MSAARAAALALLAGAAVAARPTGPAPRVGTVSLEGPPPSADSLRDITPTFTIRTAGFDAAERPLALTLQIATDAAFTARVVDTTVEGDSAVITLARPLPERTTVWWRARARTALGDEVVSAAESRVVAAWLALVSPNGPNGTTLFTRRPEFVWSSARVAAPPGPWLYDLTILNVATQQPETISGLVDTTYTPPFELESNTSYRWSVRARLAASGDATSASSLATFVIFDANAPPATLLYQNFPNPFPTGTSATTCVWFDLAAPSLVSLEIRDLRGNFVRRLIPAPGIDGSLGAGRYGRPAGSEGGCDPRFTWDGTAQDGTVVPPGVYLVRLRTNGVQAVKKVLFRGR
jgi:hypothetical protein